jgi:hypothetical protein
LRRFQERTDSFLLRIANRKDVVEVLVLEFVNVFGAVAGDVDVQFPQNGDGLRPKLAWFGSGARDIESIARIVAKKAFGHLAAG